MIRRLFKALLKWFKSKERCNKKRIAAMLSDLKDAANCHNIIMFDFIEEELISYITGIQTVGCYGASFRLLDKELQALLEQLRIVLMNSKLLIVDKDDEEGGKLCSVW